MLINIYQIDIEKDTEHKRSSSFSGEPIEAEIYKKVFMGDVDAEGLEDVYCIFNSSSHPLHQGNSLSVSDIVEVIKNSDENEFYYVDSIGYKKVEFEAEKASPMEGIRIVYVEPGKPAFESYVRNDLEFLQWAVGGFIEIIYDDLSDDSTFLVGNEEAKLIGLKGNRRLKNGGIIAGPFFAVSSDGEEFCSLTDEKVSEYLKKYATPENISEAETQADCGFEFYSF